MKKLLAILTVIFIVSTMVAVFATSVSADRAYVPNNDSFVPRQINIGKATAAIEIDGGHIPDDGYATEIELLGKIGTTNASCVANLAWDESYIYIHMRVYDDTKNIDVGGGFNSDSIEFYFDFDNNKSEYNIFTTSDLYAGQFRVQRGGNSIDIGVSGNTTVMRDLIDNSDVAVTEYGANEYIVEVAFAHKNHALSPNIGFALQVNDGEGSTRVAQLFTNTTADAQDHCYQYTHLLDLGILDGFERTTERQRAADNIAEEGGTIIVTPSSAGSSSVAATSSDTASAGTASIGTASSESVSTSTSVSTPAGTSSSNTMSWTESGAVAADADADGSDGSSDGEPEGLSPIVIIGIVAGAIAVLAAAGIVVVLILKKKSAAAQ